MKKKMRYAQIGRKRRPDALPGQVTAPVGASKPTITIFAYTPDTIVEKVITDPSELNDVRGKYNALWIDVSDIGDAEIVLKLGDIFGLHRLALEDVVNTHQRPKTEEYADHIFLVARMINRNSANGTEQVTFFLGRDYLLTFQCVPGDCFENVRERIRSGRGRVRASGPDYLFYALLDSIIDTYFPELEHLGDRLEAIEDSVVKSPVRDHVSTLHELKRELLMLRRAIWPHREMLSALIRDEHDLITKNTQIFLRDCYDHTIQLMDIVETYREIASGLIDVYISSVSAKLNEIMKVLTIIATIFMPLGFIASLYGMNFDRQASPFNMPELGWYLGYPFALLLMALSAGGLLWYFYKAGWLGKDTE